MENSHVATAICNRDYEGEITRAGNVVYINKVLDVAVGDYEGEVEYDEITTASIPLTIDQQKYYGFGVEDIDKAQAAGDFVDEAMKKAAYNLADAADKYIFDTIFNNENVIDINNGSPAPNIYMETVYTQVVKMRMQLDKKGVPTAGRKLVVSPEIYALLLLCDQFIKLTDAVAGGAVVNGYVGRIAGFDVYESVNCASANVGEGSNICSMIACGADAITFAEQIVETEAMRNPNAFGDLCRGLHVYGCAITQPDAIVKGDFVPQYE